MKRLTHEEFLCRLTQTHGSKYEVLSLYKDVRTKIKIKCTICSLEWMVSPKIAKGLGGCPECGKVKAKETIKYHITQEQFLAKIPSTLREKIEVLDLYKDLVSPIRVKCLVCNRVWISKASYLQAGNGCSDCGRVRKGMASRKTHNLYAQQIESQYSGTIELMGEYIVGKTPIVFKCNNCGYQGSKDAQKLLRRGCPECFDSQGEKKVTKLLNKLGVEYTKQYWFKDLRGDVNPLRFDFAIFKNHNLLGLIEYDGSQHLKPFFTDKEGRRFEKQKKYDRLKNQYCKERNIPLIRIPYYDYRILTKEYLKELIWKMIK